MHPSSLHAYIVARQRMSAYEAEMIARSREMLEQSRRLLAEALPSTFLGASVHPPPERTTDVSKMPAAGEAQDVR